MRHIWLSKQEKNFTSQVSQSYVWLSNVSQETQLYIALKKVKGLKVFFFTHNYTNWTLAEWLECSPMARESHTKDSKNGA